jgi:hypothetical protein
MMDAFEGLLRADQKAGSALGYLQLAGNGDDRFQVLDEKHKSVNHEGGRSWLDDEWVRARMRISLALKS